MGNVIWITGLSGAGKSTLANALAEYMRQQGKIPIVLDGDLLRDILNSTDFSTENHGREARLALATQYSKLCKTLAEQGHTIIIATISLFNEIHTWNRQNLPGYFEVYLSVPIDELRRRDPKGIYSQFDAGDLCNVTGLDLPYDEPLEPDIILKSSLYITPQSAFEALLDNLKRKKIL